MTMTVTFQSFLMATAVLLLLPRNACGFVPVGINVRNIRNMKASTSSTTATTPKKSKWKVWCNFNDGSIIITSIYIAGDGTISTR